MNALLSLDHSELWHVAGWTMLHYLWLGSLVGLAAGVCRLVLRRADANLRYAAALTCMALLALLPLAIGAWVGARQLSVRVATNAGIAVTTERTLPVPAGTRRPALPGAGSAGGQSGTAPEIAPITVSVTKPNPRQSRGLTDGALPSSFSSPLAVFAIESFVRYLPWLWLFGTPFTFIVLTTGIIGAERLRRASHPIDDGPFAEACARLAQAMHLGRRVTVAVCERIATPVLIGIVRPIILLPPAAITGWSPDEIEMVLLHELAHVRRWDNLVNLIQRFVESLFFFHPAVWLVSNWVRREREACCDAVVVGRTNRPHAYAEMLVALAVQMPRSVLFHPAASSAMAAGPMRCRIRRILGVDEDPMLVSGKTLALMIGGLLFASTLVVLNLPSRTQAEESTTENTEKADLSDRDAGEDRAATQNNLKNLLLALLNYNDAEHGFPAVANFDANGKPLLSWRVLVLPYLDPSGAELYEKFHLDEPWDSEHNRKLIAEMPKSFKNPRIDRPGFTNYLAVVGSECMFDGTAKGIRLAQVSDGTANTIALVEADADQAVEWTKPQDWEFDRAHPTAGLGGLWSDHWIAFRVDGSSCRVSIHNPPDEVGIQFTRAGGETKSLSESAGQRGLVGGELGIGGAKPAPKPVNEFRSKFIPSDTNRYETRVYEIADAPNTTLRLDWIVEMLKRDPSEPKPYFAFNWANDWTRLEIIAPTEGQKVVESMIKSAQGQKLNSVRFVVGASRFLDGDKITITEVRGTAETFEPGNIYWIKGTYTLGSHDRAKLAANNTAMDAAHGTSSSLSVQSTNIDRGEGTFSLFLPMLYRGRPHVSFYPSDGGQSFGGVYFGTGDSVPKQWLGANVAVDQAAAADDTTGDRAKFPSLEDQRLADLGWKGMRWELEPIGDEDLRRVRALGYEGGLKVADTMDLAVGRGEQPDDGDILVGLHVWPTTSLKDVAEVLNRDDLDELNPLKFYVVRRMPKDESGYVPGETVDKLVTGRISVQVDRRKRKRSGSQSTATEGNSGSLLLTPTQPTRFGQGTIVVNDLWAANPELPKALADAAAKSDVEQPTFDTTTESARTAVKPAAKDDTTGDRSNLRYDGRTFEEWRKVWLSDLVVRETRLEALRALEAFAAAGYREEAANAILPGAFSKSTSIAPHSRKYLSTLPPPVARAIAARLVEILQTELAANRRIDAIRAIAAIGPNADSALEILKQRMASDDPLERIAAAAAIKMIVGKEQYQKPVADVLGEELGITVVESDGVWGALPRDDVKDGGKSFTAFTEAVIKEQQQLFPGGKF